MIHTIIAHELCEVEYFVRIQPLLSKTISDIGNHDCVTVFQGQTGCSLNVKFLSTLITCIAIELRIENTFLVKILILFQCIQCASVSRCPLELAVFIAELFQRDKSTISRHIRNIFAEGELDREAVVAKFATTASDGKTYQVDFYNLDVIISVGYRVRSLRGTQFRIWANSVLKEYLIKGFAMNDDRLKDTGGKDYFDELLERVRDIRSSEKVFWRKVLDIYATSADYSANARESTLFFQTVQNKMLYAATGMTAAELIANRADALKPLMGMTVVKGSRPTLAEAKTAKNYLYEDELKTLNRLVSAYLDLAELQALRRKPMFMKDWIARLDDYLQMTDSEVLQNAGSVSHALAEQKAKAEYEKYKRLHRDDVTPVEVAFLDSVEQQAKQLKK